jgi:hypothetical protein
MELLAAAQGGAPSLPAANALHLITVLLKIVAETAAPSTLAAVFEVGPNMPATHQGQSSLAPMFLNRVVQLLINCKPRLTPARAAPHAGPHAFACGHAGRGQPGHAAARA